LSLGKKNRDSELSIAKTLALFLVFSSAIIKGEEAQIDLFAELLKFAEKGNAEAAYHMVCFIT